MSRTQIINPSGRQYNMLDMHNVLEGPRSSESIQAYDDYIAKRPDLFLVGRHGAACSIRDSGDETVIEDVAVGRCPVCGKWTYAPVDRPRTECCGRIEPTEWEATGDGGGRHLDRRLTEWVDGPQNTEADR